jgi:hypothetical protein
MMTVLPVLLALYVVVTRSASKDITISNAKPRLDTNGNIVDAHNGNIVGPVNGTYFLYGEYYGSSNFAVTGSTKLPKLSVYTSTNLTSGSWYFHGLIHNNTSPGWSTKYSSKWPWAPLGSWYSPSAIYSEVHSKFIIYWSASQKDCCLASWGIAQSDDGIHFELVTMEGKSSFGTNVSIDGSSLLVDDDGVGYVAFDAMNVPNSKDHIVAIDKLSPNLLGSSGERMAVFPDYFVEGAMLFKRGDMYYTLYGSCCCACRQGSGASVWSAKSIQGPWNRQPRDVNCKADGVEVCAGMPSEQGEKVRPTGMLTIAAQGIALSVLKNSSVDGRDIFLWQGMRWLSGKNNPKQCSTLCTAPTGVCKQDPNYHTGNDFDYWYPLKFDQHGKIQQFDDFVDNFTLSLPNSINNDTIEENKGYPIYQAHAKTHFELGLMIGNKASDLIHLWLKTYTALDKYLLPFSKTDKGISAVKTFQNKVCNSTTMKIYCDELRGMSNATGIPFNTFFILSLRHELTQLMKNSDPSIQQDPECTDVLTKSTFAHNEDGTSALLDAGYYVNASVKSTNTAYFSFNYPASPSGHAFGVNLLSGMGMSMNAVFPKSVDLDGVPIYFLTRMAMGCKSATEIKNLILSVRSAYGGSLNIGSAKDGVVNIEFGPTSSGSSTKNLIVTSPPVNGSAIFHMNEYLYLHGVPFDLDPSSEHRLKAAKRINVEHPVSASDSSSLLYVLSDRSDRDYPLWRNTSGLDDSSTAATALFEFMKSGMKSGRVLLTVFEKGNPMMKSTKKVVFEL